MSPSSPNLKPAVVIGGVTSGLAVVRSLGRRGVPIVVADYDRRAFAGASRYARDRVILPDPVESEASFVQALSDLAGRWGGSMLIPCTDQALVAVARNKASLGRDYVVGCDGWEAVQQVIEKRHSYAVAESIEVAVPRTLHPSSMDDVARFAETAAYPCLVKPDQSHLFWARFGVKMFSVANASELKRYYQRSVDAGLEVVLQEFIPGAETAGCYFSAYRVGSRTLAWFTAGKVRSAPPSFGSPRVAISRRIGALESPTLRLLDAIGLEGFSCTEYKHDPRDGRYKLMEVNARHNLSTMLAVLCGVDFPWIHYQHRVLGEVSPSTGVRSGVYWIDLHSDIKQTVMHVGREPMTPLELARPYLRPHVFAVDSLRDPGPMLRLARGVLGRVVRRIIESVPAAAMRATRYHRREVV